MTTEDIEAEKAKFLADLKARRYDRFERQIILRTALAEAGDILAENWVRRCAVHLLWFGIKLPKPLARYIIPFIAGRPRKRGRPSKLSRDCELLAEVWENRDKGKTDDDAIAAVAETHGILEETLRTIVKRLERRIAQEFKNS
jgi:hypothetical protein